MNLSSKAVAVLMCATFAASGCKSGRKDGIYSSIVEAIEKHCDSAYPCLMGFDAFPSDWEELTVFPYGASESPIQVGPGAYIDTRVELCDRYMVVTRTGSRTVENHDRNIETIPNGELVFSDSPGLRYTKITRGDMLLIALEPSSSGGAYYSIKSTADRNVTE